MKQVRLPGTDLFVSRFAFGTASIHHLPFSRHRKRLLAAAVEQGFTHFDTAPYYGYGEAERSLASILRDRQDLTVATKVGLYPPGGADQPYPVMFARKAVGKMLSSLSRAHIDFAVTRARDSLTTSLARLKRDRIDILFLHDPEWSLIAADEWLRWLDDEKDRVRYFGIAGEAWRLWPFIKEASALAHVIQTADSLDRREADLVLAAGRPLQLTYGYLSSAGERFDTQTLLSRALARNKTGAVIVSTRRLGRLRQYPDAVARAERDERARQS